MAKNKKPPEPPKLYKKVYVGPGTRDKKWAKKRRASWSPLMVPRKQVRKITVKRKLPKVKAV